MTRDSAATHGRVSFFIGAYLVFDGSKSCFSPDGFYIWTSEKFVVNRRNLIFVEKSVR